MPADLSNLGYNERHLAALEELARKPQNILVGVTDSFRRTLRDIASDHPEGNESNSQGHGAQLGPIAPGGDG